MEIRGEDFVKKVQLKQEEQENKQRLNEIKDAQGNHEGQKGENTPTSSPELDKEVQMQEEQEYDDIMLDGNSSSNSKDKRKYIILGLILIILFLLTIIIIRLLSNNFSEGSSFSKTENTQTQKVLNDSNNNSNIEEEYQKLINEKLKNIKEEKEKEGIVKEVEEKPNLNEEKDKIIEPLVQNTKSEILEAEKPEKIIKKELAKPKIFETKKAEKPEKITKQQISKKVSKTSTITSKPSGIFVQIGAFLKMPSKEYLNSIEKKGFKYKIYKVSINKKLFHKVLVGPYKSRVRAKLAIKNIKKKLNISSTFIATF